MADGEQLLGWIREVDTPDAGLLLVGHNPGIGWLARSLLRPDPGAAGLPSGFPAGSLAVFSFDADCWLDVHTQGGTLVGFTVPAPDASR